jgi:hypothetical protein
MPAEYSVTCVKTFIVSHDGVLYEKDLAENPRRVQVHGALQPDKSWIPAPEKKEEAATTRAALCGEPNGEELLTAVKWHSGPAKSTSEASEVQQRVPGGATGRWLLVVFTVAF